MNFTKLYSNEYLRKQDVNIHKLWHYTSANGLMGIVRNTPEERGNLHFWFTRSDCLNDTSEGYHILDLYKNMLEDLLKNKEINKSFFDSVKDAEISNYQLINFPVPSKDGCLYESMIDSAPCHAYICCFSLKEDSLDMWRYYSKGDGGYGLGLYSYAFFEFEEYQYGNYNENDMFSCMSSFKVIYKDSEKRKILKEIIIDTYSAYQNSDSDEKEEKSKKFIQYALKTLQYRFKHECYSSEQEFRFVFYLPYSKPKDLKNKLPEVKYRNQNGILVPYIEIVLKDASSILNEVWISPFVGNMGVLDTTSEYLSQCGFSCKIKLSRLPVRK